MMRAIGKLIVYGAGGHGLVVAEAAAAQGWKVAGFRDDRLRPGTRVARWPVLKKFPDDAQWIVAIGDNAIRWQLLTELQQAMHKLATVIHPTAVVSPSAILDEGVYLGPLAIVQAMTHVGTGTILNSSCVVEHDNRIGQAVHIAPGSILCGRVSVGNRALIGAGATVMPGVTIGENAVIGAGSMVRGNVRAGQTVAGNPAKPLR